MRRSSWVVWCGVVMVASPGCAGAPQVVAEVPQEEVGASRPALAWVVSEGALVVLDTSGAEQRRVALGIERADGLIQGRGAGEAWVLSGRSLYGVDVEGGAVRAPLELPLASTCEGEAPPELSLQAPADLGLFGEQLCVVLQDRNDNMMDFQAIYRVDPSTGAVSGALTVGPQESCAASSVEAPCRPERLVAQGEAGGEGLRLDQGSCAVVLADGRSLAMEREAGRAGACELEFAGRSASGRFQALTWDLDDSGDYIYRRFVVVDTAQGRPVLETAGQITAETPYQWAPRVDALLLDGRVLLLGDAAQVIAEGVAVFVR